MICGTCGREVAVGANFCRHCGAPVVTPESGGTESPSAGGGAGAGEIDLRAAVAALQQQVRMLTARIASLETAAAAPPPVPSPPSAPPRVTSNVEVERIRPAGSVPPASTGLRTGTAPPAATPPGQPPASAPGGRHVGSPPPDSLTNLSTWNWEWLVGGNWLARIGIVALIIGIGFFLKLAFDNDWIGEMGRVALGLVAGIALLGAGEYWRVRYPVWSQAVSGGGLAVLYLSVFAAYSLYGLISPWAALGFSFLVTVLAAGLALRSEAKSIAILGILGGFATPPFLADDIGRQEALLGYVLVLDVGVLALSTFRNWRWFTLLALFGSLFLFAYWETLNPDTPIWLKQAGITAIFLIFVAATTLFHIVWRRTPEIFDHGLTVVNAAGYLGFSYQVMWDEFRPWMGAFTLLLALFYGILAYGIFTRHRDQAHLSLFALGIAVTLVAIAVPVQLDAPWVAPAWAVQGAVLVWLSFTLRMPAMRGFAVLALAAAAVALVYGVYLSDLDGLLSGDTAVPVTPFLNAEFLSHFMVIVAISLAAFLWRRGNLVETPYQAEEHVPTLLVGAANLVILWTLSLQLDAPWVASAWAVQGAALVWLSFTLNIPPMRGFAIVAFVAAAAALVYGVYISDFDGLQSRNAAGPVTPFLNAEFLSHVVVIVATSLAAFLWRRGPLDFTPYPTEEHIPTFLLGAANLVALWTLSLQIAIGVFYLAEESNWMTWDQGNTISLSLSFLWAAYAAAAIVLGIIRKQQLLRLGGLALLALPVLKLFLYDSFQLEQEYRVAAFIGLGALLLSGGFLYQRFSQQIRGFLLDQ